MERHYLHAFARIMMTCEADAMLTGDVMQSVENSENGLRVITSADKAGILPYCAAEVERGNEVRRFGGGLVAVLNATVKFTAYGSTCCLTTSCSSSRRW